MPTWTDVSPGVLLTIPKVPNGDTSLEIRSPVSGVSITAICRTWPALSTQLAFGRDSKDPKKGGLRFDVDVE